jgi:hypothetical protein
MDDRKAMKGGALAAKALLLSPSCDFHGPRAVYGPSFESWRAAFQEDGQPAQGDQTCRRSF